MLVSTTMRPVTAQAFASSSITSTASSQRAALAAVALRDRHADEAGLGQRLDVVPGVLLGAVDGGGARAHDPVGEGAGAVLQRVRRGRQVHGHSTVIPGASDSALRLLWRAARIQSQNEAFPDRPGFRVPAITYSRSRQSRVDPRWWPAPERQTVNHSLGLTFYCSGMPLDRQPPELPCVLDRSVPPACLPRPPSRPCWRCRSPAARPPATTPPARSARATHAAQRSRVAAVARRLGRAATATIPDDAEAAIAYARALARHRSARPGGRRARAGLDPQSAQHAAARRLWPRAGRGRQLSSRRSTCSAARIRRTIRTGASSTRRARCSIRWAATPRRSAIYSSALKIVPDEPSVLSNLGLSYALIEGSEARRGHAAARGGAAEGRARRCGRIWRWWSACAAASPRPRRSPAPICRRTKPPPMSAICGRCWRSRSETQRPYVPPPDAGT